MEPRSWPILSCLCLPGLDVSRQGGDNAVGRCCARRKLPDLLSSGKGAGDSKAALHLHCRNFHHCNPNQVLLLAGTRLRGLPLWSKSANPVLPQFPCAAEPAARCVWLPGRKAGTAAAHVLALAMFARAKGECPWFTPCLLGLRHAFKLLLHDQFTLCSHFCVPQAGGDVAVCELPSSFLLLVCSVTSQVWSY